MRIAHIMLARAFGGAERSFVDLSCALAERGHEVLAIGDERGKALAQVRHRERIEAHGIRCYGSWDRLAERTMRRELLRFQPALVHVHLARAAQLGGRAAHSLGLKVVAKTHNLVNLKYYQHIDCLVPTTRAQEQYLLAAGVAAEKLNRIPNFSAISAVATPTANGGPPWRLRAIGRFVHKKGFDLLLDAVAALRAEGHDVELELAGDGPLRKTLMKQIQALDLDDHVRLAGWVDDAGAFLRGADLFVLPSRDEPFGIVLLEAMASGVPVLATRTQGPLEILNQGNGFLSNADDAAELARDIALTLAADDRRARAVQALADFHAEYSDDKVVGRYLDLYTRLTA